MECNGFRDWLINRDMFDNGVEATAMEHLVACEGCRRLFAMDSRIEARVKEGMKEVEVPDGLWTRIEMDLRPEKRNRPVVRLPWKGLVPAFTVAILLLLFFNPFGGKFASIDEIERHAIKDHLNNLTMTFKAEEVRDVTGWFSRRLGFRISVPDLEEKGFQLVGGRKCRFGNNDVAYLLYKKGGKRASLFIIDAEDLNFTMAPHRTYSMSEKGMHVKVWTAADQVYTMVE